LIGLSLVTVLGMSGIVGMYTTSMASEAVNEQARVDFALARQALAARNTFSLPERAAYIIARSPSDTAGRLVYAGQGVDAQPLLREALSNSAPPIWSYSFNSSNLCMGVDPASTRMRYGSHPAGTYYQYASCLVSEAGVDYEIGFSLARMEQDIQAKSNWVWGLILGSSLLVLGVFPRFFRTSLIRPLDRLLDGVRQADSGDLDIQVPVTYQDEVGFLTTAFNKMTASLKEELSQRQRAEAELRQLNLTLEQRVADRTRELEALYDVSAAASQAQDSPSLLNILLERSLLALNSTTGMILLLDESPLPASLQLVASRGLPPDWEIYLASSTIDTPLLADALRQHDPLLIPNMERDTRAPDFMRATKPLTLILAPFSANGQVLGLIGLARDASLGFDLDEVALLVSIVSQVGTAVHTDRLRQLAQRASVLEERQRLARDLHDSVTQSLYGLATLTEAGKLRLEARDLQASAHLLTRIGQTTRQAIREMRLFLHQLRPPVLEQEGLVNALELRLAAVEGRSDIQARLEADESIHLPLEVETDLYHIAQEALNNALKHAAARTVTVRLQRVEGGVALEIVDDGRGFDLEQISGGGMGLDSIRARAKAIGATLSIQSALGQGTCMNVYIKEP
jgi:signal transduction histidine kinase